MAHCVGDVECDIGLVMALYNVHNVVIKILWIAATRSKTTNNTAYASTMFDGVGFEFDALARILAVHNLYAAIQTSNDTSKVVLTSDCAGRN